LISVDERRPSHRLGPIAANERRPSPFLGPMAAALACLLSACLPRAVPDPAGPGASAPTHPPNGYVGVATCRACHSRENEHWGPTLHGRLFLETPRTPLEARGCESCHGPGAAHAADPADPERIVSFTRSSADGVDRMNGMCLQCHAGGDRIFWRGSIHETQGLACSDCHNPMGQQSVWGLEARVDASSTCFGCHPQQRTDFGKRSHMPLLEGKISCVDCHEPHGSVTDPLIRADSVNQLCYQCHAEKRGPFLWEHAPVLEDCLGCHLPHGSNHLALLVAIPPFLCQRCHAQPGGFGHPNDLLSSANLPGADQPDTRLLNRGCVNCHVQIHGSNHPSGARFHR
jgi:DmsE family decaheme c-type cytochrome